VKGKNEATRIFALLGDSALKATHGFIDLSAHHDEMLRRFRAKEWDAADALRRECDRINGRGLDRLYALYKERIAYFRKNPPPPDWDGTAEALGK
jgi:adenylate cyclase